MRVVLANHGFARVGGTEMYVLTLAEQLQRLGHEAVVYAHELGPFSDHARDRGVDVRGSTSELPEGCDLAFAQDAVVAYELADRYPAAPLAFRACSDVYDFELPPQLAGVIDRIVVMSDRYERLVRACGISAPVTRLRYPIDVDRLAPRTPIGKQPRRAIVLGNYEDRLELVSEAWGRHGVAVDQIGGSTPSYELAEALSDADVVVAKGRAALDAMATARAVYVYDHFGGDGWVTPELYPALEADNFAGQATGRVIDAAALERDLAGYEPDMGIVNRDLVMQHHDARAQTIALLQQLDGLRPGPRPDAPLRELARLTALQWSWERRARELERELRRAHERSLASEGEAARAGAALAEARDERERLRARADEVDGLTAAVAEASSRAEAEAARADGAEARAAAAERAHEQRLGEIRSTRAWRTVTRYWRLKARLGRSG